MVYHSPLITGFNLKISTSNHSCRLYLIFPLHIVSNVVYVIRNLLHEHTHKKVNLKPCHISNHRSQNGTYLSEMLALITNTRQESAGKCVQQKRYRLVIIHYDKMHGPGCTREIGPAFLLECNDKNLFINSNKICSFNTPK